MSYALALIMLTYLITRWLSSIKLAHEKQKLEQTVKDRTMELKEKNLQLEDQAEKLKETDKVKSRFFANISHEFRTPHTLIMGPLEHVMSETRASEQQKKMNLMLRNSQRWLGLINQLLELSKFESGTIKLQSCPQNIIPFLKGIADSFGPIITKNELDLTFQADEEDITLYFDPGKLEEVLFNLLSNAVKFTPPGGKITVKVTRISGKEENFPSGSVNIAVGDTSQEIPSLYFMEKKPGIQAAVQVGQTDNGKVVTDSILLKPKKNIILLEEDSADFREYIRKALEPLYTVFEIRDGLEGLQKAQEIIPDLIISDVMMPGLDGYELCRELKNHITTRKK